MGADKETRWRQRFQNYSRTFLLLEEAARIANPSDTERAGLIQFFEIAFELAWKTLKDCLEAQGFLVASPRDTLKQAFQSGLISDGRTWMEALDDHNLTTRTDDESASRKIEKLIKENYLPLLKKLHQDLGVRT